MLENRKQLEIEKKEIWYVVLPLLIVLPLLGLSNQIFGSFKEESYICLNLIIQILIIVLQWQSLFNLGSFFHTYYRVKHYT